MSAETFSAPPPGSVWSSRAPPTATQPIVDCQPPPPGSQWGEAAAGELLLLLLLLLLSSSLQWVYSDPLTHTSVWLWLLQNNNNKYSFSNRVQVRSGANTNQSSAATLKQWLLLCGTKVTCLCCLQTFMELLWPKLMTVWVSGSRWRCSQSSNQAVIFCLIGQGMLPLTRSSSVPVPCL